jgi:hypothetical protein
MKNGHKRPYHLAAQRGAELITAQSECLRRSFSKLVGTESDRHDTFPDAMRFAARGAEQGLQLETFQAGLDDTRVFNCMPFHRAVTVSASTLELATEEI